MLMLFLDWCISCLLIVCRIECWLQQSQNCNSLLSFVFFLLLTSSFSLSRYGQRNERKGEELSAKQTAELRRQIWAMASFGTALLVNGGHTSSLSRQVRERERRFF